MKAVLLLLLLAPAAHSVPVIPNFKTGTLTSHQETTSKVTETIVSEEFNTGFEYTATGTNVEADTYINPISETTSNRTTVQRVTEVTSVVDTVSSFSE